MLGKQPEAIQLRYLQTLTEITNDNSKIIVFPLPLELGKMLKSGTETPLPDDETTTAKTAKSPLDIT